MMCRKKRCITCKKVLDISKFGTYKKKDGETSTNNVCKSCEKLRDSKTAFKRGLESYISRTMYHINRRDY